MYKSPQIGNDSYTVHTKKIFKIENNPHRGLSFLFPAPPFFFFLITAKKKKRSLQKSREQDS